MRRCLCTYIIILCGLFTGLLPSCSKSGDELTQEEQEEAAVDGPVTVSFEAKMTTATGSTRAANDINTAANLAAEGGFGVFGCYTGMYRYVDTSVNPNFMYNEHVSSTDGGSTWTYDPIKYWPNGDGTATGNTGENPHYVSFMAYAPYSDTETGAAGYCIPTLSLQGEMSNPWLTYRLHTDVAQQVDLLYAKHTNEHPLLNLRKPTANAKIPFYFDHALACVGDKVTIQCSDAMKDNIAARIGSSGMKIAVVLTALDITYTLTEKGRLVLWNNGEANWQPILSGNTVVERTVSLTPGRTIYLNDGGTVSDEAGAYVGEGYGVYYIPLDLNKNPQKAHISLTYEIRRYTDASNYVVERERTTETTLRLSAYPDAYKGGKHLYFNIDITDVSLLVTAAITNWVSAGEPTSAIAE